MSEVGSVTGMQVQQCDKFMKYWSAGGESLELKLDFFDGENYFWSIIKNILDKRLQTADV